MDQSARRALEFVGVQLTAVVAGIHFYWGLPRLLRRLRTDMGLYVDPRSLLFVVSAVALLAGLVLVARDVLPRAPAYALGIVLMLCYLFGWAYWHLAGHAAALPWIEGGGGGHYDGNVLLFLLEHIVGDPLEGVSKIAEAALLGVLATLLYDEYGSASEGRAVSADERASGDDVDRTDDGVEPAERPAENGRTED